MKNSKEILQAISDQVNIRRFSTNANKVEMVKLSNRYTNLFLDYLQFKILIGTLKLNEL